MAEKKRDSVIQEALRELFSDEGAATLFLAHICVIDPQSRGKGGGERGAPVVTLLDLLRAGMAMSPPSPSPSPSSPFSSWTAVCLESSGSGGRSLVIRRGDGGNEGDALLSFTMEEEAKTGGSPVAPVAVTVHDDAGLSFSASAAAAAAAEGGGGGGGAAVAAFIRNRRYIIGEIVAL